MIHKIVKFFDKLEDKIRTILSRRPILYAFIGAVGIVLFWRGVWMTADMFPFMNGPVSIFVSVVLLLLTGLFVYFFIGDKVIISGLKQEKKMIEKTEEEIKMEKDSLKEIQLQIEHIDKDLEELKSRK
ncbi:MAG: hypothetical protein AAB366_00335 [Patescibacteria group bacterium]